MEARIDEIADSHYLFKESLSPEEVSRYVDGQVKAATVRRWINERGLPATPLGKGWMVRRSDIESWLGSRAGSPGRTAA